MKPLVLLSTASSQRDSGLRRVDSLTGQNYSEALADAGALPVMVSNLAPQLAREFIERAQALILTGGADVDPQLFGEEPLPGLGHVDLGRDEFEIALYRAARERGIPVLGICRGIQVINVAEGGTLIQHLGDSEGLLQHDQRNIGPVLSHTVSLEPDSILARALGKGSIRTNSFHHQAIKDLGQGLRVVGRSSDGVIEAVEGSAGSLVLGVQWHPEMLWRGHPEQRLPFELLLRAVGETQAVLG